MPTLISMSMSPALRSASAKQFLAAASARRRAVVFRAPLPASAKAASMCVPITVRQVVDGEDGDADLDARGEREQHHAISLADLLLVQVLVQRHEQRGRRRVAVLLQIDDHVLRPGAELLDKCLGASADGA